MKANYLKPKLFMFTITLFLTAFLFISCNEKHNDPIPNNTTLSVDGAIDELISIPDIATANNQSTTQIKAAKDSSGIFFLIIGNDMKARRRLFIDADNNITTGFKDIA